MAISIQISDTVGFKVKGVINDSAGIAQPFDFKLTCNRLTSEEIQAAISDKEETLGDFLATVVQDWSGVKDAANANVPYSTDALKQLCKIPGVAFLAYRTYLSECGAKEKN